MRASPFNFNYELNSRFIKINDESINEQKFIVAIKDLKPADHISDEILKRGRKTVVQATACILKIT